VGEGVMERFPNIGGKKTIIIRLVEGKYIQVPPANSDNLFDYYSLEDVYNAEAIVNINVSKSGNHYCSAVLRDHENFDLKRLILSIHDCKSIRNCLRLSGLELSLLRAQKPQEGERNMPEHDIGDVEVNVGGGSEGLTPP
jgi:hypothetical protein